MNDYLAVIQDQQLDDQILDEINAGKREREKAESWAIGKVKGQLQDQYDLDMEFTPTLPYDSDKVYGAGDRCTIDFPSWEAGKFYPENSRVIYNENGYLCLTEHQSAILFDDSMWQGIGNRYDIYNIPFPYPIFSLDVKQQKGIYIEGYYSIGDKVWWNGRIYTALAGSRILGREESLNYQTLSDFGYNNIFPNSVNVKGHWKDEGAFSVQGVPPIVVQSGEGEAPVWELGDNRDPIMVQAIVDLSLYILHKRIAPMNIPQIREDAKNETFEWLRNISKGQENTSLIELQPSQGEDVTWGTKPKSINGY